MTLELDYAYLAEYATVQDGKITAVGASFTHVTVGSLPGNFPVTIAGRIRASEDVRGVDVAVEVIPPSNDFAFNLDGHINVVEPLRPYEGKLGLLFALNLIVPLSTTGLYVINFLVDGELARRLAFDVGVS
jgi:hypothetical protein